MQDIKRIFISDIHMSSEASIAPPAGQAPYGWLSPAHAQRLGDFLSSSIATEANQLFLVGDVVDLWTYPIDVKPPSALDVINAPHNQPVVAGIRAFAATQGKQVIYIPGNHDMKADASLAHQLAPNIVFGARYDEFPLHVRHGHDDCLFNGADPAGRPFPLGYFITRCTATATARNQQGLAFDLWTVLRNGTEVCNLLKSKPLSECVIDVVLNTTSVRLSDSIVMPDGTAMDLATVRAMYQNLVAEWNQHRTTHAITAIMNEWDPFYDMDTGVCRLYIAGHSHRHKFAYNEAYGMYLNLGSWCDADAYFGKTWVTTDTAGRQELFGQIFSWQGNRAVPVTTAASVATT